MDARQRAAVEAVCTDVHRPYLNAVADALPAATVVLDKFHVLQHAGAALDEVRRHEFFRAGAVMRRFGRGKRWLLLRRWKTVRGSKREELRALFGANRRLFKAYVLREELDHLWTYKTRDFAGSCGAVTDAPDHRDSGAHANTVGNLSRRPARAATRARRCECRHAWAQSAA